MEPKDHEPTDVKIKTRPLYLHEITKRAIIARYIKLDRNKVHTAKSLGICIRTLFNKLRSWGIK